MKKDEFSVIITMCHVLVFFFVLLTIKFDVWVNLVGGSGLQGIVSCCVSPPHRGMVAHRIICFS